MLFDYTSHTHTYTHTSIQDAQAKYVIILKMFFSLICPILKKRNKSKFS